MGLLKGRPEEVIAALELLATLVGIRLWVPEGEDRKTSRVAIRGYTDNKSNESLLKIPVPTLLEVTMPRTKPPSVQRFVLFSLLLQAAAWGADGHVTVFVDCSAALHARVHCPSMPLAGRRLAQLLQALSRTSLRVQLEWVPAHGLETQTP